MMEMGVVCPDFLYLSLDTSTVQTRDNANTFVDHRDRKGKQHGTSEAATPP